MRIFKKLFIFFLVFLAIKDLSLGLSLLFKLEWLLNLAKLGYTADVKVVASFFGVCVLIVSTLCILAIKWTAQNKEEGIYLGKFIGWWMVIASVVVYFKIDRLDFSIVDFISGVLILIPGYLQQREA